MDKNVIDYSEKVLRHNSMTIKVNQFRLNSNGKNCIIFLAMDGLTDLHVRVSQTVSQ